MFILNHVKPEDATGKVAEAYSIFPEGVPIPAPLLLMSASPDLAQAQSNIIRYYMGHEKLDAGLLSMIRYLVANELDYEFCINFNQGLLKMAGGFSDDELKALRERPEEAPLEDFQKELLLFVLKVVKTPEKVRKDDVERLRGLGWTDQEIFDAAYHGVSMVGPATLIKAFSE